MIACPAMAAPIDAQAVNTATIASLPIEAAAEKPKDPDPAIVHLQVLLDRAGASPGVIDGYFGENLTKAIAGFEALQRLPIDGKLDPKVLARFTDEVAALQAYAITADDAKDIVESIPRDYAEQAKMEHLGYTSVAEKLAERFHMDIGLLKTLNPIELELIGKLGSHGSVRLTNWDVEELAGMVKPVVIVAFVE